MLGCDWIEHDRVEYDRREAKMRGEMNYHKLEAEFISPTVWSADLAALVIGDVGLKCDSMGLESPSCLF